MFESVGNYKVRFDLRKGLINSLENRPIGGALKFKYFLETTRNAVDPDEWIAAVYKDGQYTIVGKTRDTLGNKAKNMHWKILRKIKENDYKIDGLFDEKSLTY